MTEPFTRPQALTFVALSGGIGGAKLALGLSRVLPPEQLTIVGNTADDFEHLGLEISPDLDTVMYTLAGKSNAQTGWGRAGETWAFMNALEEIGGETWFRLGDLDLAVHVERTRRLRAGESLTEVTRALCRSFGVETDIVPMSDQPVQTLVHTKGMGTLTFQHYLVRERCEPAVTGFSFEGIGRAEPSSGFRHALTRETAVIICPSNPFVSVDPILALPRIEDLLRATTVIAVSPIVGGKAIKGPAAKMMSELGIPSNVVEVARHYTSRGLLTGFVIDEADASLQAEIEALGIKARVVPTVMQTLEDRIELANRVVGFARELR